MLDQIAAQPDCNPQVYQNVREALVSGYPYCVYYREEPGQVVILSVFHTARDPSIWPGLTSRCSRPAGHNGFPEFNGSPAPPVGELWPFGTSCRRAICPP